MHKIAVVGSRVYSDKASMYEFLNYIKNFVVGEFVLVSGGAKGADYMAECWAKGNLENKPIIHIPDWSIGKQAGMVRNQKIVDESPLCVLAFMLFGVPTKGTLDTIHKAKRKNIPVYVVYEDSIRLIGENVLHIDNVKIV